jgi:hypothetical protein
MLVGVPAASNRKRTAPREMATLKWQCLVAALVVRERHPRIVGG